MCSLSMFNSFIKANSKHTLIWRICERRSTGPSHVPRRLFGVYMANPLGFEPRISPPKGAVLPLHHGVSQSETLDWPFCIKPQLANAGGTSILIRITPKAFGAVLPLHHGVRGFAIFDWRFSIQAQCPKFKRDRPRRSNSLEKSGLN